MQTWLRTCLLLAAGSLLPGSLLPGSLLPGSLAADTARPNVILILCDDLNDYVEGFGGHPDSQTPNLARLARSGMRFLQAHCNAPICAPSRASLFTGIYPHHSGCFGFQRWDRYPVLKNSRTLMDHFRANGYHTLGTGKLNLTLGQTEFTQTITGEFTKARLNSNPTGQVGIKLNPYLHFGQDSSVITGFTFGYIASFTKSKWQFEGDEINELPEIGIDGFYISWNIGASF